MRVWMEYPNASLTAVYRIGGFKEKKTKTVDTSRMVISYDEKKILSHFDGQPSASVPTLLHLKTFRSAQRDAFLKKERLTVQDFRRLAFI
jgi:hypothetical protein